MNSLRKLVWAGCLAVPSAAQVLRVDAAAVEAGGTAVVPIVFEAGTRPAAALEFTLAVPAGKDLRPRLPAASAGLRSAGKSISCTGSWKKPGVEYRWRCVLAGGAAVLPSGVVASAAFTTGSGARRGDYPVAIEKARGASPDAKPVDLKIQAGKLTIR